MSALDIVIDHPPVRVRRSLAASARPAVLVVSTNADLAGAPSHVRDLVLELQDRYHFTVVFGEEGPIQREVAANGIRTIVIKGMRSAISPLKDLRSLRTLVRIIREVRPAVIHAHSSKAGMVARAAGALTRVPVIYTVHGWGFGVGRPRVQSVVVQIIERVFKPLTNSYIGVSRADGELARAALGLDERRFHVVPNGVSDSPLRADARSQANFVMVARLSQQKDHETALRAFSRLNGVATSPAVSFTLIGSGTESESFASDAARWAESGFDRIQRLGPRTDIAQQLSCHGVFVLASRYEGMPLSIIEAMRCGLPIIASRVGGVGELVVDGANGLLVEPGDVAMMTAAMQRLADDPALRARMGAVGRAMYEKLFSVERMCMQVSHVYRSQVQSKTLDGVPA